MILQMCYVGRLKSAQLVNEMKTVLVMHLYYLYCFCVIFAGTVASACLIELTVECIKSVADNIRRKSKKYWVAFPFKVGDKVWISKPCFIGWKITEAKARRGTVRGVSKVSDGLCISFSPDEDPEPRMWSNYAPKDIYITREAAERAFKQEHKAVVE